MGFVLALAVSFRRCCCRPASSTGGVAGPRQRHSAEAWRQDLEVGMGNCWSYAGVTNIVGFIYLPTPQSARVLVQ